MAAVGKGQGVQSELVRWETMLLSLERDHAEKLSPKTRRALLLNILPSTLQPRILEHMDRLVDYGQVQEKVVSLVQMQRNPDAMDCSQVYGEEDEGTEEEAEGYTEEEAAMDLAALADIVCRRCNKKRPLCKELQTATSSIQFGRPKAKAKVPGS